MDCYSKYPAN